MINEHTTLTEFNRKILDTIVDKIVVCEVSENGDVIRFILKTGTEYKTILNNNRNKNVSLSTKDRNTTNFQKVNSRIRKGRVKENFFISIF